MGLISQRDKTSPNLRPVLLQTYGRLVLTQICELLPMKKRGRDNTRQEKKRKR